MSLKLPKIPSPPANVKADQAVWQFCIQLFEVLNARERILMAEIEKLRNEIDKSRDNP